ncbi:MAG: AraC family transcriptional regulator [Bacteroidia bacterium]|jgi:AraC family transcriptional regulator
MAYDAYFGERITRALTERKADFFSKTMMGGLLFMVDNKMLCGIHTDKRHGDTLLMARIGEEAYEEALKKEVCLPMDFTGRPMKSYIFVTPEGWDKDDDLEYWIDLCLKFNPFAKASPSKKKTFKIIMEPRFEFLTEKIVVGKNRKMSFANNQTVALWQSFMPELQQVTNRSSDTEVMSLQLYPTSFTFEQLNPHISFTKWACVEVTDDSNVPSTMETLTIPAGSYAVFIHRGPAKDAGKTFGYIFGQWIPNSEYDVDNRPHFELLGLKYKNNEPDSEEEVWIPIKQKEQ